VTDAGRDADGDLRGYWNLLDCLAEVPERGAGTGSDTGQRW
jgi:hypothetical protein